MTIPEQSTTGRRAVLFYENWWLMAESRDTGPKRLAFYDAIMRFAFLGETVRTPEKGVSTAEEWAAHDGYLVCKPLLDGTMEREEKSENSRKGGQNGKGVPRNQGNANARKTLDDKNNSENNSAPSEKTIVKTIVTSDKNNSENNSESIPKTIVGPELFNNIKENANTNAKNSIGGDSPCDGSTSNDEATLFDAFWKAYPGPRKQDKRKCADKFARILRSSGDAVSLFNRIMGGLEKWKRCETWTRDGGRFVCAPLVWLNNERWEAEIAVGPLSGGVDNIHREEVEVTNAF